MRPAKRGKRVILRAPASRKVQPATGKLPGIEPRKPSNSKVPRHKLPPIVSELPQAQALPEFQPEPVVETLPAETLVLSKPPESIDAPESAEDAEPVEYLTNSDSAVETPAVDVSSQPEVLPTLLIFPQQFDIRRSADNYVSSIFCPNGVALELRSRRIEDFLMRNAGMVRVEYRQPYFVLESTLDYTLIISISQLRMYIAFTILWGEALQPPTTGQPNLEDIEYSSSLEHRGEAICAICLGELTQGQHVRRTSCLHVFHQTCIANWLLQRRVCPIDRQFLQ